MPRFGVSIRGLMIASCAGSVGLAALRYASEAWAGFMALVALGALGLAVLGVIYGRGPGRAAWAGFLIFGGGYLAMAWWNDREPEAGPERLNLSNRGQIVEVHPPRPTRLLTTQVLDGLRPYVEPSTRERGREASFARMFGRLDPRDTRILAALDLPLSMPFPNGVPFGDLIKYIKNATTGPGLVEGLPIYVDPDSLVEVDKDMTSRIVLNLEGVSLGKSLELLLRQLDLSYHVDDGLVTIAHDPVMASDEAYRRIGHFLCALLAGGLGALAARRFHRAGSAVAIRTAPG